MKNLFVGNMSFQTSESELRSVFEPYGEIARVQIITDRDTGRARGFAFVEMTNDDEAAKAIEGLNGKDVNGRALNVNEAKPKSAGGPRNGGGGGGGFRGGNSKDDYRGSARQPREPRW
jgi:cold-inducible RNA-binding protein